MNILTETDKAYLAGLVDGEGCFNVSRKRSKHKLREYDFTCRVMVVNSDTAMMLWILKTVGEGGIYKYEKSFNPIWKPVHRWQICGNKAIEFIKEIYPYLQIKKRQADLLLEFPAGHKGYFGRNDIEYNKQALSYLQMKKFNQRGLLPVIK